MSRMVGLSLPIKRSVKKTEKGAKKENPKKELEKGAKTK